MGIFFYFVIFLLIICIVIFIYVIKRMIVNCFFLVMGSDVVGKRFRKVYRLKIIRIIGFIYDFMWMFNVIF